MVVVSWALHWLHRLHLLVHDLRLVDLTTEHSEHRRSKHWDWCNQQPFTYTLLLQLLLVLLVLLLLLLLLLQLFFSCRRCRRFLLLLLLFDFRRIGISNSGCRCGIDWH